MTWRLAVLAAALAGCVDLVESACEPVTGDIVTRVGASWEVRLNGGWPRCWLPAQDYPTPGQALDLCHAAWDVIPR